LTPPRACGIDRRRITGGVRVSVKPSYEDGHLIVASVRVLSHNASKPPTPEAIAELLGLPVEFVRNLVVALGEEGILRVVENPFEIRAEIGDYVKLEDLPRASTTPSIKDELDDFVERKKKVVEETEKSLSLDEMNKKKKKKMSKFEEEMKKMKGKGPSPFS
jgi:hypothetical protein